MNEVLLSWAYGRCMWMPLRARLPARERPLSWLWIILPACTGLLGPGLLFLILSRVLYGDWSFWSFWVPGSVGMFTGLIAGGMALFAWNLRAADLRTIQKRGEPLPEWRRPRPMKRWLLQPVMFLVVLATAILLTTGIENWRGERAVSAFRQELRSRNEPTLLSDVVPAPVPDERNLAMIPLFKPLFEYDYEPATGGEIRFRDTNALARFRAIRVDEPGLIFSSFARKRDEREQTWVNGGRVNLSTWQAYYRSFTNLGLPAQSQSASADVLASLDRFKGPLDEVRTAAAARPEMRFPVHYDEGFLAAVHHYGPLKSLVSVLRLRAVALLAENRTEEALPDIQLAFRLSDGIRGEPMLVSALVRFALDTAILQPVWEGCVDHKWSDAQLQTLQSILLQRDYIAEMRTTLRGERIMADGMFDSMVRRKLNAGMPAGADTTEAESPDLGLHQFSRGMNRGWIQQNRVAYGRFMDSLTQDLGRFDNHAAMPSDRSRSEALIGKKSLFTILAAMLVPALERSDDKAFEMEARRRLAVVGLALERYRLADGEYPGDLTKLAPKWVPEAVLKDPMDGKLLRYSLRPAGYHLYSVGLNHLDDGGARPERNARNNADPKRSSDLVWM